MIIYGKGGYGHEVHAAIKLGRLGELCNPIMVDDSDCPETCKEAVIAVGDPVKRKMLAEKLSYNYAIINNGVTYSSQIGEGTIIQPGAIITVNVKIGRHCQINLNATIGHDCEIGDFVTIAPGANISGNVKIGELSYIGTGAAIREKISICPYVTIGAGAVVVKNIDEPGVYVGNPAIKIK